MLLIGDGLPRSRHRRSGNGRWQAACFLPVVLLYSMPNSPTTGVSPANAGPGDTGKPASATARTGGDLPDFAQVIQEAIARTASKISSPHSRSMASDSLPAPTRNGKPESKSGEPQAAPGDTTAVHPVLLLWPVASEIQAPSLAAAAAGGQASATADSDAWASKTWSEAESSGTKEAWSESSLRFDPSTLPLAHQDAGWGPANATEKTAADPGLAGADEVELPPDTGLSARNTHAHTQQDGAAVAAFTLNQPDATQQGAGSTVGGLEKQSVGPHPFPDDLSKPAPEDQLIPGPAQDSPAETRGVEAKSLTAVVGLDQPDPAGAAVTLRQSPNDTPPPAPALPAAAAAVPAWPSVPPPAGKFSANAAGAPAQNVFSSRSHDAGASAAEPMPPAVAASPANGQDSRSGHGGHAVLEPTGAAVASHGAGLPSADLDSSDREVTAPGGPNAPAPQISVADRIPNIAAPAPEAPAGSSAAPQQGASIPDASASQFVKDAHLLQAPGQSEMRISMHSDQLGAVEVRAHVVGDQFGAAITVEKRDAHTALAIELPALRQLLNDKNLPVDRVVLLQGSPGSAMGDAQTEHHGRQSPPPGPLGVFYRGGVPAPAPTVSLTPADMAVTLNSQGRLSVHA